MDITVGAVGFLHVRDVVVGFHDGPVERVVVGDVLYTGQLLTLLAWLFEFVGKRARGVRLRDAIEDETSRATTAARDDAFDGTNGAQSRPSSAGAFIARSRSLARQSSSNPGFDPRLDPTNPSLGSPPHASSSGHRPSMRASADTGRDPRASGNFMKLNVPVLVAGLRVKLRGGPNGGSERGGDLGTRRDDDEKGIGDENEEGKRTTRGPPLAWSTWQLLKNAATFVKITVTDVAVDASGLNTTSSSSSLAGVHTAARAVVAATTAFKGRGVTWTAMVDRVVVGAPAAPNEPAVPNEASSAAASGDSTRGYLLDARVDISARYSARERRAVCVGVELDVGEVDLVEESGWTRRGGKTSSNFFEDGFSRVSSSSASASASSSSSTTTVEGRLRSLPATVSFRVGRVRVRRVDRDGSDPPLVGSGSDLSVRVRRATKEERVARHRRENRSLFPDKETIAKITARTTVEARWQSLDLRVTDEEDRVDEDNRSPTSHQSPGVEARSTCGEANLTAHFPLLDDANAKGRNGSTTDPNGSTVPKATVRAEVRRADGCNHPALVRAVASAIRSVAGQPDDDTRTDTRFPSVQKNGGRRRNRTRAVRPEWTCDATLRFIDGVRVRAHDGDRGVCGEWRARRWELSEDDAPLFGSYVDDDDENENVDRNENDDENGEAGESNRRGRRVEPSKAPSSAFVVEGIRVALSPVDVLSDPRATHSCAALRRVLIAERLGGSKGPVPPPPEPPGSWATAAAGDEGTNRSTNDGSDEKSTEFARDLELMGATIDVTCADAVALDRSWRRTIDSLARSVAEVAPRRTPSEDGKTPPRRRSATSTSTAVTLIDACARVHADMPTRGHPDVDVTYAPSIPTNSKCALDLTVPLSRVVVNDRAGSAGWRLETSGWHVTYHDGVCADADPASAAYLETSGNGRADPRAENGATRVLTVEHGAVDFDAAAAKATVSADGARGFWQPDAHFAAQEAAAAARAVAAARASDASDAASDAEAIETTETDTKEKTNHRRFAVGLDLTRVTVVLDVTPGGAVTFDTNHLASDDVRRRPTRASNPSVAVNGYRVFSSEFAEVNLGVDAREGAPRVPSLRGDDDEGSESSGKVLGDASRKMRRRSRARLTVGADTRLVLPWGLDLGDAQAALDAGYAALVSVGGLPFNPSAKSEGKDVTKTKPESAAVSPSAANENEELEFTLEVIGALRADVFDSPLARCVRGKCAVLGPALASARAAEAAQTHPETLDKQAAYARRLAAYVAACAAAAADNKVRDDKSGDTSGASNGGGVHHESAARVTIEGATATFVLGGYESSHSALDAATTLEELRAVPVSRSEACAIAADAPWSDDVRLRVYHAARIRIDARDASVDLPLSPAPIFRASRIVAEGVVVTARQATVGSPPGCPPPLPLPVGRRRFAPARHPEAPSRPPVKLYTDVDVTLENPGGCFAVSSEPALVSLSQQLVRLSPPSNGHANAPGGRGGRARRDAQRAAASWEAAAKGWPKGPDGCYGDAAPSLPPWDFWRASWRGRMRVTASELAYVIDARPAPTIAEIEAGPVGLEVGASRVELAISPGEVNLRAARATLSARGGVGTPGHDPDDEQPSEANGFGDADVSLEEKSGLSVCLAVVPAVEFSLGFDWQTLGEIGGGGQDHHRFDSSTGRERVPIAGQLSVGCHLRARATLTTKERALPEWRNAAGFGAPTPGPLTRPAAPTPASKDRVGSLAAAEGTPGVGKVAGMGTPGAGGTPGSLTKWSSGDFFARISGGGAAGDGVAVGDEKDVFPGTTPTSPSSPAFASRVSAAAAAAVADEANTPTLIVGPRALRWLRRFAKDLVSPSGAARRSWRTPAPGAPRRARHPLAKSIDRVVDEVSFSAVCDNLRVAHPAETSSDPARGLTAQVTGLRAVARLAPAPPGRVSPYPTADGLKRRPRYEPSCRLDTLEVELEEVRVLLPPAGNDGEVLSPGGGGATGRGSRGGAELGFGTGDFDQEAEGYKAVIEMLEGRSAGGASLGGGGGGSGSPGPGDGSNSPGGDGSSSEGRAAGGFGRESRFARRRRETATDPALVLETRSVRLVRRVDSPAYLLELASEELAGGRERNEPGGGSAGSPWLHVTVESPRLLKAASTRDALIQWIRDAYRAALKPNPPKRSLTSLRELASRPDETIDPETGFKITAGASGDGEKDEKESADASGAERLGLPNHPRPGKSNAAHSSQVRAKSASNSHMGVGLFDDDFDLIDDGVFGEIGESTPDEEAAAGRVAPAGRRGNLSWDGSPSAAAGERGRDHPNEADLLSLLLSDKNGHKNGPSDGSLAPGDDESRGKSPEPESAASSVAHRRSRSELPASLAIPPHPLSDKNGHKNGPPADAVPIAKGGKPKRRPEPIAEDGKRRPNGAPSASVTGAAKVRREERDEEEIIFVVDVTTPQINFEGKDASGRFLLAAVSGRVVGRRARRQFVAAVSPRSDDFFAQSQPSDASVALSPTSPTDSENASENVHWGRRVVAVRLLDAQAHVAPMDVDVYAGVQWLDESLFAPAPGSKTSGSTQKAHRQEAAHSYLLRQVFKPCRMDLDFTTHIPEKVKIARGGGDATPSADFNPSVGARRGGDDEPGAETKRKRPEALTEFALRSPEIEAEMSSDQFTALVDVIGSIFLAQIPDPPPRPAAAATALLAVEGRSLVEGEERTSAAVVAGPLAAFRVARWAATCAAVDVSLAKVFAAGCVPLASRASVPGTPAAAAAAAAAAAVVFDREACVRWSRRLARRVEDAEREVDDAVASAEALVRPTRRRPAIKLSLSVDTFRWALRVSGRTFLVARIERLTLWRERHVDSSGVTNLRCHELALDVPPPKVQGARTDRAWADQRGAWKPVLARWDPSAQVPNKRQTNAAEQPGRSDAASAARPLIRVSALRAASPPEAPIWDRIEVDVQPFDLRIERDMYDRLIAYIFPEKNYDGGATGGPGKHLEGHDAYARSLTEKREEWRRRHGSVSSAAERGTPSKATRGSEKERSKSEAEARKILLGTMSPQRFPPKSLTNAQSHKRSNTWAADLFQAMGGTSGGYRELESDDKNAKASEGDEIAADRRRSRPPSLALIDADGTSNAGQSQSSQQQPQAEEHKKVVVRHLKVNEVLLRVSYDGKPRSFHEVRLLLDEVVTNHFTGRWRDLIGQLKGNVVWSVLKSITGLQGRRLPGNSAHASAAPTIVKVDSPVKANSLRDKASESETEDAFGDDDEEEDAAADATGSDGGRPAAPKRATRSLFKRVFGMAAFKTAAASPARPSSSSAEDEREKLARLMGERR